MLVLVVQVKALKECTRVNVVRDIPCNIITSHHPTGSCSDYNVTIFNQNNSEILTALLGEYIPTCNLTFNYTKPQTYFWNSTVESGIITVTGDEDGMILTLGIFLFLINLTIAYIPFKVKSFTENKAGDYVIKRMFWIAAMLFLWFNMTMFRQLSSDWGLGIDNFLEAYWWIFTLMAFSCVFIMSYVALVGALKLIKEERMKRRLGDNYQ